MGPFPGRGHGWGGEGGWEGAEREGRKGVLGDPFRLTDGLQAIKSRT